MIELVILNYLKAVLDVPVEMEESGSLKEYVLIEKTSSSVENHINRASFAIQSYSTSLYKAAELNNKVKIAMLGDGSNTHGIIAMDNISRCDLDSDYNYTDIRSKKYRYQAVFDLVY